MVTRGISGVIYDLVNEARRPLYVYLIAVANEMDGHKKKQKLHEQSSTYVFTSQKESFPFLKGSTMGGGSQKMEFISGFRY